MYVKVRHRSFLSGLYTEGASSTVSFAIIMHDENQELTVHGVEQPQVFQSVYDEVDRHPCVSSGISIH